MGWRARLLRWWLAYHRALVVAHVLPDRRSTAPTARVGWVADLLVVGPLLPQYALLLVMTAALAQYATQYFTSARVVGPRGTA